MSITIRFTDHSIATIQYFSNGDTSVPKEYFEYGGGQSAVVDNYRSRRPAQR